jgi:membrane associated rhomboid family serine protease
VVFLVANLFFVITVLSFEERSAANDLLNKVLSYIMLPASVSSLLKKPWTLITHMFAHFKFFHLLFNMLWLYWFGKIVEEFIGSKKILPLYMLGALAGAIILIASYNIFPGLKAGAPYVQALGASAGVLAIVVAAATIVPDYTVFLLFFGPVKIKWIAVVLVVIDLVSIPEQNTGGHIAHLGGALFGFIYIRQLRMGTDLASPFVTVYEKAVNVLNLNPRPNPRYVQRTTVPPEMKVRKSTGGTADNISKQERIDIILDKISRSGYDSLNKEEKEFLFKVSKED